MNKKLVTLILVILISFCFLSISVADNVIHDDDNSHIYGKTIDKDKKIDKNKTNDKNKTTDKNKTDNKSKNGHILAKGKGNDIRFSDGFRGFRLDYSKPPASPGDEFKRASSSSASNANTLKLAVIECYKQDSAGQIGKVMSDFIKSGSSNSKVGEAVAASHEKANGYVKISNHTVAIFSFEVLKSVSGNESDYFAYTVSFASINDEKDINQTNNLTNVTKSNVTNTTNGTMFNLNGNGTNSTLLNNLYDNLASFINALYDAWKPIVDTLMNGALMFVKAMEGLALMFEGLFMEIQSLMDALGKLLAMLESIWDQLEGILKLFAILLNLIEQIIDLIQSILNFIAELIAAIIALIQQLLELLFALLQFLLDLIEQLLSLLQAILDFLKSLGSFLLNVIENAVIIISAFVIITIGAFIYNRIR